MQRLSSADHIRSRTCISLCATLLLSLAVLGTSRTAAAQELGAQGHVSFGIERLFGFYLGRQSVPIRNTNATTDSDYTDFSLGWNNPPSGLTVPRLAIDYFIDDHFTIGGSFGVYTRSRDVAGASGSDTGILFAARGGYALRISHAVSFWPRAGFTYYTVSGNNALSQPNNLFALTLEGMFTFAPSESWAFLVGPTVDVSLSGRVNGQDLSEHSFGIMAGLVGWIGR